MHIQKIITYNGETMNLAKWSEKLNIPLKRLSQRLIRGWKIDNAFTRKKRDDPTRIIGQKFGMLTPLYKTKEKYGLDYLYVCKCDCGKLTKATMGWLHSGHKKSCGCIRYTKIKSIRYPGTHQLSKTRLYKIWGGLKQRCLNPKNKHYKNYGGRGIILSKNWMNFINFYDDVYKPYQKHVEQYGEKNTTIERIDNNKNYSIQNCRWATRQEQNFNHRRNVLLTFDKKTMPLKKWAEYINASHGCIRGRINRGWSVKKTITTPVKKYNLK